jgi:hypothetical protein
MDNERILLSRAGLYKMVWSEPVWTLAKKYGLSDRGLAKICARMEIPVPGRGYWQKRKCGWQIPVPPLPPLKKSTIREVHVNKSQKPLVNIVTSELNDKISYERQPQNRITISDSVTDSHSLIAKTEKSIRSTKPDLKSIIRPKARGCLDVRVGRDSIDRAMRIMDTLIKALEARGLCVTIADNKKFATCISVMDEVIEFCLEERVKIIEKKLTPAQKKEQQEYPWMYGNEYDYIPTGILSLKINGEEISDTRKTWSDGQKQKLENCLNSFVIGLMKATEIIKKNRIEREKRELEWQERRRRHEALEEIRREEEERIKVLDKQVSSWSKSQQIRAYTEAFKKAVIQLYGEVVLGGKQDKWLTWANKYADRIDPLVISEPSITEDEDS